MKTIIMYVLKGVLFLIGMVAFCVLFGEPNDTMSLNEVIVMKCVCDYPCDGVSWVHNDFE